MIKLFRNNQPLNLIVLLLVAVILRGSVFLHEVHEQPWLSAPLSDDLNDFLTSLTSLSPLYYKILSALLILFNAIYLNLMLIKHNFFFRNTYLPALCYILINSLYPDLLSYSAQLLASFFMLIMLDKLFSLYDNENAVPRILDAGIFCGIGALFSFDAFMFFPFVLYSVIALRPFRIREILLAFFGLITPVYVLAVIYFMKGDIDTVKNGFAIREQAAQLNSIAFAYEDVIPVVIALPVMLIAGFTYSQDIGRNNVKTRKIQNLVMMMIPFCIASMYFSKPRFVFCLPYFAIPCSVILSYYFLLEKKKSEWFKELSFAAIAIMIIVLQFIG